MKESLRVIISGGGTGGHIFPAVSIANAIRLQHPDAKILFVGAEGRMEMQRVPAAGYEIIGLPVAGFDRKHLLRNISVLIKLMRSQLKARRIVKAFQPDVAVGVGGYASGPTLKVAGMMGIPTLIQEQNSYAGVTNKLLAKQASKICVAYEGMERFFDKEKIILTGNPVRQGLLQHNMSREDAVRSFQLDPAKKTVLIIGGSLGARTINNCVMQGLDKIRQSGVQFIWQTGKYTSAKRVRRCPVPANCRCCTPPTSLQTWQQPTVPPTWSSVGQEPAPSPNFACWANRSSWYHRPTWQKTIRPKMHWHW